MKLKISFRRWPFSVQLLQLIDHVSIHRPFFSGNKKSKKLEYCWTKKKCLDILMKYSKNIQNAITYSRPQFECVTWIYAPPKCVYINDKQSLACLKIIRALYITTFKGKNNMVSFRCWRIEQSAQLDFE